MNTKKKIHLGIIITAVLLYLGILFWAPVQAEKSVAASLSEMKKLFVPILVAIFAGSIVKNLLLKNRFSKTLAGKSKLRGMVAGGTIGCLLPPCPYISHPLIKGMNDGGANSLSTIAMLLGVTSVATGRAFAGIAILGPKIEGLRILFSFLAMIIIGTLYFHLVRRYLKITFDQATGLTKGLPRISSRTSKFK